MDANRAFLFCLVAVPMFSQAALSLPQPLNPLQPPLVAPPNFGANEQSEQEMTLEAQYCIQLSIEIIEGMVRGIPETKLLDLRYRFQLFQRPDPPSDRELIDAMVFEATVRATYRWKWTPRPVFRDVVRSGTIACMEARAK